MSSLNPLNYSLGELKKALVGGAVAAAVVLTTVLTTSGVPQTREGLLGLLGTLVGTFLTAAVAVFIPKNDVPVKAGPLAPKEKWGTYDAYKIPGYVAPTDTPIVPEGTEVDPDPTSSDEFPQS